VRFTVNTTYRVKIDYDQKLKTVSVDVTLPDGTKVWNAAVSGTGSFSPLNRIYMTTLNDVESPPSVAEGYVDNVRLLTYETLPDTTDATTGPTRVTPDVTALPTYEITEATVRTPGTAATPTTEEAALDPAIPAIAFLGGVLIMTLWRRR
jgi:hypothetical protein